MTQLRTFQGKLQVRYGRVTHTVGTKPILIEWTEWRSLTAIPKETS